MPASHDKVAERIFDTLKGFGLQLQLFDVAGNKTVEPGNARRFFAVLENMLVSIKDDGENSEINLYLSNSADITEFKKLMDQLRQLAVHFNLQFTTRKYGKKITPRDFAFVGETRRVQMKKVEEARNPMTGSIKSSYQNWNSAKLIVRHTKPVTEDVVGSRSRNIQKIFVETIEGERFKFPVVHLAGARAMARHLGAGGTFYDNVGQHIIGLSEEFKDMQRISSHVFRNRQSLHEDAFSLREVIRSRLDEIRNELNRFMTISGYEQKVEEVINTEATPLNEESLHEHIIALKTLLQIDEDDESFDVALGRVAPLVNEKDISDDDVDQELLSAVQDAYGLHDADDIEDSDIPTSSRKKDQGIRVKGTYEAAQLLANPSEIKFTPKNPRSEETKQNIKFVSPLQKLSWRLGAISERIDPNSEGATVLSVILSRIATKIDNAIDVSGPDAKVGVTPAQKRIIEIFIRSVAPAINESMKAVGYDDWDLIEAAPLGHGPNYPDPAVIRDKLKADRENPDGEKPTLRKKEYIKAKESDSYPEAREISEWFENFDPLKIIKESAKQDEDVEEEVEETHELTTETSSLTEEDAWWVADFLIRGKAKPSDIVMCYENTDRKVIAKVLKENWTNKTTEAIIKDLELDENKSHNEDEEMADTSEQDKKKEK